MLKDISQRTGYSVSTVSRALDDSELISNKTKIIIQKVAREMGYNVKKRVDQNTKNRLVGIVVPDISNYFFSCIVQGVNTYFQKTDFGVIIFETGGGVYEEKVVLKKALRMDIEGLIIFPSGREVEHIRALDERELPIVIIGSEIKGFNVVDTDNKKGAYLVTNHLISLGHSRIGLISGRLENNSRIARLEGYKQALMEHNIPFDKKLVWEGSATKEFGYECTLGFLKANDRPTGIVSQNDLVALGAMTAAEESGLRVPQDLAIAGYDDTLLAKVVRPALTSVVQPKMEMGDIASKIIEDIITGKQNEKTKIIIAPRLIIRDSTMEKTNGINN
jgi:DNA-binding LacI/PurR family transcriptional regulator